MRIVSEQTRSQVRRVWEERIFPYPIVHVEAPAYINLRDGHPPRMRLRPVGREGYVFVQDGPHGYILREGQELRCRLQEDGTWDALKLSLVADDPLIVSAN